MINVFYGFAMLLVLQGAAALLEGLRYLAFVRRALAKAEASFTPKAAIIAPCKGLDPGLEVNLRALFHQDYPPYEILFAVASNDDAALSVIEPMIAEQESLVSSTAGATSQPRQQAVTARVVIARPDDRRGEKVNNLLAAIEEIGADCEVLAFVDSDALVRSDWLRSLVEPLAEKTIGATTGYRWYLPVRGGFFAALLSAWNGSVATALGAHNRNFAWGGSTAILKKRFEQLKVRKVWQQAVSDDYALTSRVQKSGLRIAFVPRCLTISRADATLVSLLEFTTRQVIITRVYNPALWWTGIISQGLFTGVFFGGLLFAIAASFFDKPPVLALWMLAIIYLLGSAKGIVRLLAARKMLPEAKRDINNLWWMYGLGWVLVSAVYLYNFAKSATTRRIRWRGVIYELRSPEETLVIRP